MNKPDQPASPGGASRRKFLKTSAAVAAATAASALGLGRSASAADPAPASKSKPGPGADFGPKDAVLPRAIHPYPNQISWGAGTVRFSRQATLAVGRNTEEGVVELMRDTWQRFTLGAVALDVIRDAPLADGQLTLTPAGSRAMQPPKPEPRATYALTVDAPGVAASATDATGMRHAWFTLLQLVQAGESHGGGLEFALPHVGIQDWPAMKFRGLHLCVFPETPPLMIEKAIRLAAFFKFTHVVLEFWGMVRLDALKELSWPEAWSKAQAGQLIGIARGMGLEVIPMHNAWGHAAASRIRYGRHVVLDQNPQLAPLFEPDGWTWCLTNPRAQALLRSVFDEQIELAGPGQFFHIGCDEAYSHATCDRCRPTDRVQLFADHINNLAAHVEKRGRRAIMWGDPLLERAKWPAGVAANGTPSLPTHEAIDRISRRIVITDWRSSRNKGDAPTLAYYRGHGFETLACQNPPGNILTLAKAAAANNSLGLLITTWHRLVQSIPTLAYAAACTWSQDQAALGLGQAEESLARAATATLLRKLVPADGKFDRAGWNPFELPTEVD